jgi:hypothetical protein
MLRVNEERLWKNAKHRRWLRCRKKSIERAVRGCSKSERSQQDRADERKYGEHRQHIEPKR